MYAPLRHLAAHFQSFDTWPTLADYQALLDVWPAPVQTLAGKALRIVAQDERPGRFEEHYAPRIYHSGELQTRCENWHDFLQFLSWLMFPATKAVINAAHLPHAKQRLEVTGELGRRSSLENMLSLFDEGGAVIVSSDETLLQLINPHFSPPFVARRFKGAACLAFVTKERAGILDSLSSTPTERTPSRACHWAVAVEGW